MIFVGDIALPFKGAIKLNGFPEHLKSKSWFGNLEGAVVDGEKEDIKRRIVFNDREAIAELLSEFDFKGVALANNHIFDTGDYEATISFLNKSGTPYCGTGRSIKGASRPLVLEENGQSIVVLNFGWEVIQCEVTSGYYTGVNPLRKEHVIQSVMDAVKAHPKAKIVAFMHWSYELEAEPQPFERELARRIIDLGVVAVIGCHPHRIGGFEMYKDKPIIYSLGNWLFKQHYYREGKSKFPDFCNEQLAFEMDFNSGEFFFHFFNYNKDVSNVEYIVTEGKDSPKMKAYTPFRDLSSSDYKRWYKQNRYHKGKGLPVYYWEDSRTVTDLKNRINVFRDHLVGIYLKLK